MKKNILVTGGTGFIGSHCVVELVKQGYNPIIVDNLSNSLKSVLDDIEKIVGKKIDFYEIDLIDKEKLEEVFKKYEWYGVIHFASAKAVYESIQKPFFYYENNILSSFNLFELMDKYGVKNIIFSSSAAIYDGKEKSPLTEDSNVGNTTNPYGTTKIIIENILRDLSLHKGFNVVSLRYFNPIGAHESGLIGEKANGIPNNLLPYVFKVIFQELPVLKVFGGDYDTPDGSGIRDFIHVVDLIDAHIKSIEFVNNNNSKNGYFEIFNIGTGKGTSVLEIIEITEEVISKKIPYKICERRPGDLPVTFCTPSKANKILKWEAKYSVKKAIKDSYNFYKKNM